MDGTSTAFTELETDVRTYLQTLQDKKIEDAAGSRLLEAVQLAAADPVTWAPVDLHAQFDAQVFMQAARAKATSGGWFKAANWLDLLRNVAILFPVGFTWHALAQASEAYYQLGLQSPELLEQSFLFLWERGFEGLLPGYLRFSSVASWDFGVIAGIFIATGLVHYASNIWLEQREATIEALAQQRENLVSRLVGLLSGERRLLGESAEARAERMLKQMAESLGEFRQQGQEMLHLIHAEHKRLTTQGKERATELQELRGVSAEFRQGAEQIAKFGQSISKSFSEYQTTTSVFASETGQLRMAQTRLLDAVQSLEGYLGSFEQVIGSVTRELGAAAQSMGQSASQHQGALAELASLVAGQARASQELAAGQAALQTALTAERGAASAWVAQLQGSTSNLEAAVQQMGGLTGQLTTFGQDLRQTAQISGSSLEQLAGLRDTLSGLKGQLSESQSVGREQLGLLSASAEQLAQFNGRVTSLFGDLAMLNTRLGAISELINQVESYTRQMQGVSQQTGQLGTQLDGLRQAIAGDQNANVAWSVAVKESALNIREANTEQKRMLEQLQAMLGESREAANALTKQLQALQAEVSSGANGHNGHRSFLGIKF